MYIENSRNICSFLPFITTSIRITPSEDATICYLQLLGTYNRELWCLLLSYMSLALYLLPDTTTGNNHFITGTSANGTCYYLPKCYAISFPHNFYIFHHNIFCVFSLDFDSLQCWSISVLPESAKATFYMDSIWATHSMLISINSSLVPFYIYIRILLFIKQLPFIAQTGFVNFYLKLWFLSRAAFWGHFYLFQCIFMFWIHNL